MQDYFARLADRAAVADAPPFTAARSAVGHDPFEDVQPAEPAMPAMPPATRAEAPIHHSAIEEIRERVETTHVVREELLPIPQEASPVRSQLHVETEPSQSVRPPDALTLDAPSIDAPLPQRQQLVPEPRPQKEVVSSRPAKKIEKEESEEIRLLRKADAFMEQVVGSRRSRIVESDEEPRIETRTIEAAESKSTRVPRLDPVRPQQMVREPEREPQRTTLTIGKLTVEVVPPPPPLPVQQPTQIVVVRGARGGRSGIPSSRRYGLRQF